MLQVPDRITLDRKAFMAAARIAHTGTQRRSTIPALAAVKVTANGTCAFEANDLDQAVRTEVPYEGKQAQFIIPNAENLAKAIGAVGGAELSLGGRRTEKKHLLSVRAGEFSAELESLAFEDYPTVDRVAEEDWAADISAAQLAQIMRVMPAISSEETRYYLNGIAVHHLADWTFRFAATDGHRLFVSDVPLPGFIGSLPAGRIIPRRWWNLVRQHLARSKDAMRLAYGPKVSRNETDATLGLESPIHRMAVRGLAGSIPVEITTKLIDGTYPDYSRVIPNDCTRHLRTKRAELIRAVNALQPLSTEKTRAIKLTFSPNAIRVSLHSPTVGDSHIDIDAEHDIPQPVHIGLNCNYLLDCLRALTGEEVTVSWPDAAIQGAVGHDKTEATKAAWGSFAQHGIGAPTLFTDPSDSTFFAVLMPMRV